jgi:chromosome segregation ATPase
VSIPLLCCLLGAALYVYEYGGTEPTLTTEFLALEEDVAASSYDAAQLDQREQEAATRLRALLAAARLANLDETLAELRERFGKLQQQESDLQRLQELLEQIAAAEIEVANLERQREERERQRLSLFSGYDGPYVLV